MGMCRTKELKIANIQQQQQKKKKKKTTSRSGSNVDPCFSHCRRLGLYSVQNSEILFTDNKGTQFTQEIAKDQMNRKFLQENYEGDIIRYLCEMMELSKGISRCLDYGRRPTRILTY